MWYIYTMEYYPAIKKKDIMPFAATWMELETLVLSEVSQKEKDKYHMISHIWNLIYGTKEPDMISHIWNLIYGTKEPFHRKENH